MISILPIDEYLHVAACSHSHKTASNYPFFFSPFLSLSLSCVTRLHPFDALTRCSPMHNQHKARGEEKKHNKKTACVYCQYCWFSWMMQKKGRHEAQKNKRKKNLLSKKTIQTNDEIRRQFRSIGYV